MSVEELVAEIAHLKSRNSILANNWEQEKKKSARLKHQVHLIKEIDDHLHSKSLDEMTVEELRDLIEGLNRKLKVNALRREVLGQKEVGRAALQGIMKRKLRVARQGIDVLNKLQQLNTDSDSLADSVRNLKRATETVLIKWSAVK
jgi:uncharacterized membrane protein YgaE (UPF0421/DUF939 family)